MADVLDFEMLDDLLIIAGIILFFLTSNLILSGGLVLLGILMMRLKGESGKAPPVQDRENYRKIDTGTDEDFEGADEGGDSDDADDSGDDGGGDGDGDD